MAGIRRVKIQSAAQVRMRLLLVRVTAMHHHIDIVERVLEEVPISLELERVRHDARRIRKHAIFGDNCVTLDATGTEKENYSGPH